MKQPVQSLQQSRGNTTMAVSEGGGLEHLCGLRGSPTLTQPRSAPAEARPVRLHSQEGRESHPSPEVRPSRGSLQDHPWGRPVPGVPLPSKMEKEQTRRREEEGKKKYGRGIKSLNVALSCPYFHCSSQLLDLQCQRPERHHFLPDSSVMCRNMCRERGIWGPGRMETRLHL